MGTLMKSFLLGTTGTIALLFSLVFGSIPRSLRKETNISNLYARIFPIYFGCLNMIFVHTNTNYANNINMLILIISIISATVLFLIAFSQDFFDLGIFGWTIYYFAIFLLHVIILAILLNIDKMFGLIT